jgi:hypothetical protein
MIILCLLANLNNGMAMLYLLMHQIQWYGHVKYTDTAEKKCGHVRYTGTVRGCCDHVMSSGTIVTKVRTC